MKSLSQVEDLKVVPFYPEIGNRNNTRAGAEEDKKEKEDREG